MEYLYTWIPRVRKLRFPVGNVESKGRGMFNVSSENEWIARHTSRMVGTKDVSFFLYVLGGLHTPQ